MGSEISSFSLHRATWRSEGGEDRVGDLPPPCVCGRLNRKTAMRESPALGHSVRPRRHSKGVRRSGCRLGSSAASRPPARRRITRSAPRGWPDSPDRFRGAYSLVRRVHAPRGGAMRRPERHGVPGPSFWHRPQGLVEGDPGSSEHLARGGRCSCLEGRDHAVHVRRFVGPASFRSSVRFRTWTAWGSGAFGARGVTGQRVPSASFLLPILR